MAGKRVLYQPAPSTISRDKRTRRPLVQGRLVTDTAAFSIQEPQLMQGQLVASSDSCDDPTLQPAMSLPMLTGSISPPPEPLHCLDLSDAEDDVIDTSHKTRPKPVMVFDASHLRNSPHGAEVEVVVAYENSPARVICHTPGKLERSFRVEQSSAGLDNSGGDCPDMSIKVDRVLNFGDSLPKSGSLHQSPILSDDVNKKGVRESRNKSHDPAENYISQRSRGIIEEILVQELGNSNMEDISLHSDISPSSGQQLVGHKTQFSSQGFTAHGSMRSDLMAGSSAATGSSQKKEMKKSGAKQTLTFPQPKFEDESDDLVPVKDTMKDQPAKLQMEYSGSETCSLHEYVTPHKSQNKQVVNGQKVDVSSKNATDKQQTEVSMLIKKKKMKKVPSRYLQGSANTSDNQNFLPAKLSTLESTHQSKPNSSSNAESSSRSHAEPHSKSQTGQAAGRKSVTTRSQTDQVANRKSVTTRSQVKSKKPAQGKSAKSTSILPLKAANTQVQIPIPVPTMQSFVRSDSPQEIDNCSVLPSSNQKTSTPTHNQACHMSQDIDASAIHSVSAISVNTSLAGLPLLGLSNQENKDMNRNFTSERSTNKRNTKRPTPEPTTTPGPSQLQLDLQYSRYLQWAFLNSKAKKVFQEQEQQALAQINGLMNLVEAKEQEKTQLEQDVARLKRINLLNSILDKTMSDLESVISIIPQLQEYYMRLSQALDTTRHQLPTRDVYIPEDQELYEEKLEESLRESAQLLADINALTADKSLPVSQYVDGAEAIEKNVSAILGELRNSQDDVTNLQGLTTRLTSLRIQNMQVL